MSPGRYRKITPEFKQEAAPLVQTSGRTVGKSAANTTTARVIGLCRWRGRDGGPAPPWAREARGL